MTTRRPDWQTLNAYVDGELSAAEAAEVARALADDRALAEQVASLSRLKASVQDLGEGIEIALPGPRRRAWRPAALAASLVVALAIGLAAALVPWPGSDLPAWLAQARALHEAWNMAEDQAAAAPAAGGVVLVALSQLGPEGYLKAYLPDLSSARLRLSHLEIVALPGARGEALHAGYRGTRGCKVSLLMLADGAALPKELTRHDEGGLRTYAWRTGGPGYLLVAEGMDEARLALIAETVHRATLEHSPFDVETRTALRESRARSKPCLA
jgi:anti-sigma factor RsiW